MFSAFSKAIFEAGLPAIPLFRTSNLPAVPEEKISQSNTELHILNWQSVHAEKACGIPFGVTLPSEPEYTLIALAINNHNGDMKLAAKTILPSAWVVHSVRYTYFIFRAHIDETPQSESFFLPGQTEPVASVLGHKASVKLLSHMQLPTRETVENLETLTGFDLLKFVSENTGEHELHSEPFQLESQERIYTLSQLDVKMRVYIAHFCFDLLLNSDEKTTLLPYLQEIEALFDSFSRTFDEIPPNHQKTAYLQAFYSMIYQERIQRCVLLPPNWSEGIGTKTREKYEIPFTKSDTQFTFARIQEHIYGLMSQAIGSESKMLSACQQAMDEIARSFTLTKIEMDQLKRYISRQSGIKLNMSKMDSQIRQLRNKYRGVSDVPTIVDNVTAFLNQQTEHRYDAGVNSRYLHRWNGTHWERVDDHEIANTINTYFASSLTERSGRNLNNILQAVKNNLALPLRRVSCSGVNFNNGFVDSRLSLLAHDPDMGLTYTLPFTFHPDQHEPPPKLKQLLDHMWPNHPDSVDALQEAMATTFFQSATLFQRAILLYGPPDSGKSQILNIIRGLVPPKMRVSVSPDKWQDPESLAPLSNKMLNLCGELSEKKPIHSQRFKDIVDGSEVTLKKTVHSHHTLYPTAAHWFASNHLPKTEDFSDGFTRRWLILKTDLVVPKYNRVVDIGNKIVAEEKDRIISWALQAYPRLLDKQDFTLPETHHQLVSELGQMNNNVRYFFEAAGIVQFTDPDGIALLRSLPQADMLEQLRTLPSVSGRHLYTTYCVAMETLKCGAAVSEPEFYRRSRELSSIHNFLQVVGRDDSDRITVRYFGLSVETKNMNKI